MNLDGDQFHTYKLSRMERSHRMRSLITLIMCSFYGVTGCLVPFSCAQTLRGGGERGWENGGGAVASYSSAGDGRGGGGAAASTARAGQTKISLSAYWRSRVGPMSDHVEVLLLLLEAQKASKEDPGGRVVLAEANNLGLEQSFPPRRKTGQPRRSDTAPARLLSDVPSSYVFSKKEDVEDSSPCACCSCNQ